MEGIGEDVMLCLYGVLVFSIFVTSLYYLYIRFYPRHHSIHSENLSLVNNVRSELLTNRTDNNGQISVNNIDPNTSCPICLSVFSYPIETNCGHAFCGKCFLTYWRIGRWNSAVNCPSCRQKVTILFFCFTQDSNDTSEEKNEVLTNVKLYNRRFSGQPLTIYEYIQDLPTVLRHCLNDFFTLGGLLWVIRFRIIICLLLSFIYFLCPSDIFPESVFGFLGIIDDIIIGLLFLVYITVVYRRYLIDRQTE